jgi:hypothetical protein
MSTDTNATIFDDPEAGTPRVRQLARWVDVYIRLDDHALGDDYDVVLSKAVSHFEGPYSRQEQLEAWNLACAHQWGQLYPEDRIC